MFEPNYTPRLDVPRPRVFIDRVAMPARVYTQDHQPLSLIIAYRARVYTEVREFRVFTRAIQPRLFHARTRERQIKNKHSLRSKLKPTRNAMNKSIYVQKDDALLLTSTYFFLFLPFLSCEKNHHRTT